MICSSRMTHTPVNAREKLDSFVHSCAHSRIPVGLRLNLSSIRKVKETKPQRDSSHEYIQKHRHTYVKSGSGGGFFLACEDFWRISTIHSSLHFSLSGH